MARFSHDIQCRYSLEPELTSINLHPGVKRFQPQPGVTSFSVVLTILKPQPPEEPIKEDLRLPLLIASDVRSNP
jgi:hypothetical protein